MSLRLTNSWSKTPVAGIEQELGVVLGGQFGRIFWPLNQQSLIHQLIPGRLPGLGGVVHRLQHTLLGLTLLEHSVDHVFDLQVHPDVQQGAQMANAVFRGELAFDPVVVDQQENSLSVFRAHAVTVDAVLHVVARGLLAATFHRDHSAIAALYHEDDVGFSARERDHGHARFERERVGVGQGRPSYTDALLVECVAIQTAAHVGIEVVLSSQRSEVQHVDDAVQSAKHGWNTSPQEPNRSADVFFGVPLGCQEERRCRQRRERPIDRITVIVEVHGLEHLLHHGHLRVIRDTVLV